MVTFCLKNATIISFWQLFEHSRNCSWSHFWHKNFKWDILRNLLSTCSASIWWIFATAYSEAALLILILKMLLANKRVASILDDMETFSWYCFKMQIRLPFSLLLLLSSKASEKEEKKSRQDKGEKSFFFYILSC